MWCQASAWQGTFQDFFTFTSGGLNCHGGENVHLNCIFFILGGFQQRRHWASLHIDFTCLLVESSRDLTWHQDDHCCLLIRPSFSQVCNAEIKFPDLSCFRAKLYLFSAHFHIKKKKEFNPRNTAFAFLIIILFSSHYFQQTIFKKNNHCM